MFVVLWKARAVECGGKFEEEKEEKLIAKEAKESQKKEREGDFLQMQRKVRVKQIKMRSLWLE